MIGITLSQYRIVAELGRGGMGIVYKATDTKLNRTVALKVLPAAALASEDDRARFFREAQAAAQLHHPNIATVFQIDEAIPVNEAGEDVGATDGPRPFIAMEFIEGETLQDVVKQGPVKLADAVRIATMVAEALKAAHAKQIVHRDIKSANVMLTPEGVAKVLDFGLAKTNQSTMLTRMGSTLGTIAYMSPEQARGQEVDGRSDLYSLGTVLYEMLAGRLPFAGEYEQAVVYSILNEMPEALTAVRTGVPMGLEWIVNKLMSKEPRHRYQTAADLVADLETVDLSGSGLSRRSMPAVSAVSMESDSASAPSGGMPTWGWGAVAVAVIVGIVGTWFARSPETETDTAVIRTTVALGTAVVEIAALNVSRSGHLLAYSDGQQVRVRDLQSGEEWGIPDTENITALQFNDAGDWLLLQRPSAVLRVQVRGGTPISVASVGAFSASPNWGPDGTVIYQTRQTIESKSLVTGETRVVVPPDSAFIIDDAYITRDKSALILAIVSGRDESGSIRIVDLPSGKERGVIHVPGIEPWYVESGHLLYTSDDRLYAVPVDLEKAEQTGPVVPLMSHVARRAASVTDAGHLFYVQQQFGFGSASASEMLERVSWDGTTELLPPAAGQYEEFDIHSDGRRAIIDIWDGSNDLWILDLLTGVRNRLTSTGAAENGVWYPGTDSVVYVEALMGSYTILMSASDGSGKRVLYESNLGIGTVDPSPDGTFIVYASGETAQNADLFRLNMNNGESTKVFDADGALLFPKFSPDGRFVAYSDFTDADPRVWMQPVGFGGARYDVSRGSGHDARWAPDGSALFYREGDSLYRVDVSPPGGPVVLGNPEVVYHAPMRIRDYAVLPDGSGFVHSKLRTDDGASQSDSLEFLGYVNVVFNWQNELEQLAPSN